MAVLFLALTAHHVGAALYLLFVGWGLGKLVTFHDAFAWELLGRGLRIPRVMRP